jgi:hypothetical protein
VRKKLVSLPGGNPAASRVTELAARRRPAVFGTDNLNYLALARISTNRRERASSFWNPAADSIFEIIWRVKPAQILLC